MSRTKKEIKTKSQVFFELLQTIKRNAINNENTIKNVELFVNSWTIEYNLAKND